MDPAIQLFLLLNGAALLLYLALSVFHSLLPVRIRVTSERPSGRAGSLLTANLVLLGLIGALVWLGFYAKDLLNF